MKSYTVKSNRNQQLRSLLAFKGESQTVEYDFTPWEEDNGSVSSVVWTVKSGQAGVSNESLASSIASALITTSDAGSSLITLTATSSTGEVLVTTLRVVSKDPEYRINDYGICG
jgi:hypothetical protein